MIVIPAIDLRAGVCSQVADHVASMKGVPSDRPSEVALWWERSGFRRLHVMDLDAVAGSERNQDALRDLLSDVSIPTQLGGGVSSGDDVERLLDAGADLILLGPRALAETEWLDGTAAAFPGRLIVAARVNDERVDAPRRRTPWRILDLVEHLNELPLAGILLAPDHAGDGISSRDLFLLEDAVEASAHPLLVAGGVRAVAELRALSDRGVAGAIVGQALYSGALDARAVAEEFAE
jgi:phosphoribosylformimino-5-aminoimidazole carboxamide ribotide isomerase